MYVVYINLLYFLSIFLFTYNKNLLSPKKKMEYYYSISIWHDKEIGEGEGVCAT